MKPQGPKVRLAMLASGSGTNVANFIEYFRLHEIIEVALVVSDNPDAMVLKRAAKTQIPHVVVRKEQWTDQELVLGLFHQAQIDFVVLAGYLFLIPEYLIQEFPGRIVNIHPALLPKFGGKGMYGMRVHEEVISQGEYQTGITIHYVNEHYDEGEIIFQAGFEIAPDDTPDTIATKVHQLEYKHYPRVVEELALKVIM
ncbi:MAG: phosphoribosylglycinamide formyltransferase [Bacteroidales bacterium]|jgi:phosphoribosylglycinamide formyltransferase-1|nr:phosphoribosylglycinamide formyltransferase [Bacteroidales bacterium]NLM92632.1 phosphoribosylglycinamide formyltransferase [Bacteroidales bacterium]